MERQTDSGVLLLYDNAPAHTSQVAMAAATDCGFEILPHPPNSPDLTSFDFYLFPKLKIKLRGRVKQVGAQVGKVH
jgi:histone-lysine N-methyltransferase SETMAR